MFPPVLAEKMEELGEALRLHFNIEEFAPVSLPAQVLQHLRAPLCNGAKASRRCCLTCATVVISGALRLCRPGLLLIPRLNGGDQPVRRDAQTGPSAAALGTEAALCPPPAGQRDGVGAGVLRREREAQRPVRAAGGGAGPGREAGSRGPIGAQGILPLPRTGEGTAL